MGQTHNDDGTIHQWVLDFCAENFSKGYTDELIDLLTNQNLDT